MIFVLYYLPAEKPLSEENQFLGEQFLSNFWLNNFSYPSLSPSTPASQPLIPFQGKQSAFRGYPSNIVFDEI